MARSRVARCLFSVFFLLSLTLPATSSAVGGLALRLQAERAAAEGRCDDALPLLARARSADPSDARAALVAGKCQILLRRYADAESTLGQAKQLAPDDTEVDLYLGMARYHLDDLDGAETALQSAALALHERAEVHLYLGLIALKRGEAASAAQSLARSRAIDPAAVDPIASFYEGLAREAEGQRLEAESALLRAQRLGKGTIWADQAAAALVRLGSGRPPPWKSTSSRELEVLRERSLPWWVSVTAGGEYDSNVALRGNSVRLPQSLRRSKDDIRFVYSLEAGFEAIATPDWTLGLMATYYGTAHESLQDFDTHYPGASVWLDRRLQEHTVARFQYDFSYDFTGDAWVGDSRRFLLSHIWTAALYQDFGTWGNSRLFTRFRKFNFFFDDADIPGGSGAGLACPGGVALCGPAGVDEQAERDRDGWGFSPGFDHTLPFWDDDLVLRVGYRFHYYNADGRDFSFTGNEVQTAARIRLPWKFQFEAFFSYTWQPYRHRSSFPDPSAVVSGSQYALSNADRNDGLLRVDAVFERAVSDRVTLSARYAYFDNNSNVDVFDYQRHIAGLYATLRFSP